MILQTFRKDRRASTLHRFCLWQPVCGTQRTSQCYQLNQREAEDAMLAGSRPCRKCFPQGTIR